nr:unnamed protein product [Callosobruchus analis]
MIYNGLEFGVFFEVPLTSPCYMILRGINPVLQMIFTFMQMYFIFMNSRLNIHRFKVIARFGLMHVVATNICVWIRTLVIEYLKEITNYHLRMFNSTLPSTVSPFAESIRLHNLRNSKTVLGSHRPYPDPGPSIPIVYPTFKSPTIRTTPSTTTISFFRDFFRTTTTTAATTVTTAATTTLRSTTSNPYVFTTSRPYHHHYSTPGWRLFNMMPTIGSIPPTTTTITTTTSTTTTTPFTTTLRATAAKVWSAFTTAATTSTPSTTSTTTTTSSPLRSYLDYRSFPNDMASAVVSQEPELSNAISSNSSELLNDIIPEAFRFSFATYNSSLNGTDKCGRVNIMGTIVQDSSPYLYPFIIEYSLIGAAVIYVMWKHIGRNPRYVTPEDLEHRLEIMLSRRAVALAQAQQGRVDCVGASKGLFFGLLMLVGSLICLILFFVLVHHKDFGLLAIYLADVSHCALMVLSIIAIIIGFFRVQSLKFKTEEQSDLNDILLRVSAFGLFLYAVFSVIAGHLNAFTREPNLLVMITGALSVLQLLFIADVSRRRVHLPEHDRSKPGRQVVTFLLICNVTMWIIYTFEMQKVEANPVQLEFYGFLAWAIVQRFTLPLCIFHRFHSAVTLAEIWKTSYKARLE